MARIRQNAMKYAAEDFIREMRAAGCRKGLKFGEIWLLTWKLGMKEATTDCLCRGEKVS